MIKHVNPRAGMFTALQITREIMETENQPLLRELLGPDFHKSISLERAPDGPLQVFFRFNFLSFTVEELDVLVRNRKTNELKRYRPDEYENLFYQYGATESEIKRLGDYVQAKLLHLVGHRDGDQVLETAADVAIFALSKLQELEGLQLDLRDPDASLMDIERILRPLKPVN